jgi:hypothetical protein
MQYNFEARTSLSPEDTSALVEADGGIEVSGTLVVEAKIKLNTELPDDKAESLKEAVAKLLSNKFGTSEVSLISKEY